MITLAKYMAKQPYVDGNRIGIYGWSYGGFMAANGITKGADVISTAVSVAPVTNWRYYDNVYTERFMRTPQENCSATVVVTTMSTTKTPWSSSRP